MCTNCILVCAQQILAIISYKLFIEFQFRSDAILILVTSSGKTEANRFVLCPCYSDLPQFAMDMDVDEDICIYMYIKIQKCVYMMSMHTCIPIY